MDPYRSNNLPQQQQGQPQQPAGSSHLMDGVVRSPVGGGGGGDDTSPTNRPLLLSTTEGNPNNGPQQFLQRSTNNVAAASGAAGWSGGAGSIVRLGGGTTGGGEQPSIMNLEELGGLSTRAAPKPLSSQPPSGATGAASYGGGLVVAAGGYREPTRTLSPHQGQQLLPSAGGGRPTNYGGGDNMDSSPSYDDNREFDVMYTGGAVGPSQRGPPGGDGMRELRLEDALLYLDDVKREFKDRPAIYNEFLDIMMNYKSQGVDTPGVINRVIKLLRGYNNLILGFNTFLPDEYKISLQDLESAEALRVAEEQAAAMQAQGFAKTKKLEVPGNKRMGTKMGQGPPEGLHPGAKTPGYRNARPLGQQSDSPMLQPAHHPDSGGAQSVPEAQGPHGGGDVPPSSQLRPQQQQPQQSHQDQAGGQVPRGSPPFNNNQMVPQQQQQTPPQQHQAVEFDHAISYVTTIKKRFASDPNTYHLFLEILHTYQKEQRGIKEVLEQLAPLFQDHPDLLKEFTFFLPDAVQEQAKEQQPQQSHQDQAGGQVPRGSAPFNNNQMVQQQQQTPPQQHQAVAFDHAISYVTTIKKRFASDPNTYHSFLEILHTYQEEQRDIKEVLEQVAHLFQDHPDLLKEFTFFLPDAVQEQAKELLNRATAESESRYVTPRADLRARLLNRLTRWLQILLRRVRDCFRRSSSTSRVS